MIIRKIKLFLTIFTLLVSCNAFALPTNYARSIAMGGAFAVTARGFEVVGWNPAYLALQDNPIYSIAVPMVSGAVNYKSKSLSFGQVSKYFIKGYELTESERNKILNNIKTDDLNISAGFYAPLIAFSFPTTKINMAFTLDTGGAGEINISRNFIDYSLRGYRNENTENTLNYSIQGEGFSTLRVGLATAKKFTFAEDMENVDEITSGFTFTYYHGLEFRKLLSCNGAIKYLDNGAHLDGSAELIHSVNATGNGVGIDMGISVKYAEGRGIIGVSVINLLSVIHWTNLQRGIYNFEYQRDDSFRGVMIKDWLNNNLAEPDSIVSLREEYDSELPRFFLLSSGWQLRSSLLFAGSIKYTLNSTPGAPSGTCISIASQWTGIPNIPLRCSLDFGSNTPFSFGMGFGVYSGVWRTDVGMAFSNGLLFGSKGFSFGINSVLFFY